MAIDTKYWVGGFAIGLISYGIYFDYQRRHNPEFRKKLSAQRREAEDIRQNAYFPTQSSISANLQDEPIPTTNEGKEKYFMNNLQLGEQLIMQGPPSYEDASNCFYKALQVYPDPQKLLEVLAQSLPEPVLQLIVRKLASDVQASPVGATVEEVE